MSEHTPGPWRWVEHNDWSELVGADGARVLDDGSAGGEYGSEIEPNTPNGRLVESAPDLLAACEDFAANYDDPTAANWPALFATIAKARGQHGA